MGDMAEVFNDMKKEKKTRHEQWKIKNLEIIRDSGITDFHHASPECICFIKPGKRADFYPSTGRWRDILNNKKAQGGGAAAFLKWWGKQ